jgi:hypothetical protein
MVRRISERMAELVQEAGGRVPDLVQARYPCDGNEFGLRPESTDIIHPFPFDSDDEEGCDGEASDDTTDTDGSSVHIPSSSTVNTFSHPHLGPHDTSQSRPLSPSSLAKYTSLSAHGLCLQHLLLVASSRHTYEMRETSHGEDMLGIRSRRRVLNKSLMVSNLGDGSGGIRDGGVGMDG